MSRFVEVFQTRNQEGEEPGCFSGERKFVVPVLHDSCSIRTRELQTRPHRNSAPPKTQRWGTLSSSVRQASRKVAQRLFHSNLRRNFDWASSEGLIWCQLLPWLSDCRERVAAGHLLFFNKSATCHVPVIQTEPKYRTRFVPYLFGDTYLRATVRHCPFITPFLYGLANDPRSSSRRQFHSKSIQFIVYSRSELLNSA